MLLRFASAACRAHFQSVMAQHFQDELATLENLKLVKEPGPEFLRLRVRVQDISARVRPQTGRAGGWANVILGAVGEATLILELHDSESDEILARGVDTRAVEGAARRRHRNEMV